jgi:Putative zinc-finger
MCNKEQLVGYLYGELSAADRETFEAHIGGCEECRQEVAELLHTRQHLASWSPPEPEFNFTVVQSARTAAAPKRWLAFVPQWGLAAAAALIVLAGAAAIANLEVRYGQDGSLVVRTGWSAPPDSNAPGAARPGSAEQTVPGTATSDPLKGQVEALERRLVELEQRQTTQSGVLAASGRPGITAPELRKILAESEARQQAELAVRIGQVWNDFTAARANDFARVQQTLGQAQGLTNRQLQQLRDANDSLRYLHSISLQR